MTQNRKGFLNALTYPCVAMNVIETTLSKDKNDSEMSQMRLSKRAEGIVTELNAMHGKAKEKILELIETLRSDGVKDHQIKKILFERISFISKSEIYRVLPQELKREYTKPLPKTINISSEHKVIDVEPVAEKELDYMDKIPEQSYDPEQEIKKIGEIRRAEQKRQAEEPIVPDDEDPKDLEIQFLKEQNEELKDALHKTQQFRPANQLTETQARDMTMQVVKQAGLAVPETNIDSVLDWVKKQADGVHSFYYDAYGIDLFKNRELSQLKNSGVKVFRRLYFEV